MLKESTFAALCMHLYTGNAEAFYEEVKFSGNPSLGSQTREVERIEDTPGRKKIVLNFLGLLGTMSPLPEHYTETLLQDAENEVLSEVIELFQDRIYKLYFESWLKCRCMEQAMVKGVHSLRWIAQMFGLDVFIERGVSLEHVLSYLPYLAKGQVDAVVLEEVISDFLCGAMVKVFEFEPVKYHLEEEDRAILGKGSQSFLGKSSVIGDTVMMCQNAIRIRIGELSRENIVWVINEDGMLSSELRSLLQALVGPGIRIVVEVLVSTERLSGVRLKGGSDIRLGIDSFIGQPQYESYFYRVSPRASR